MILSTARAIMRIQAETIINDASANCTVSRATIVTDNAGHKVRTYESVATNEKIWIQPISGRELVRAQGVGSETSHVGYQQYSGYAMSPNDRILPSGESYAYDVVAVLIHEAYRELLLKRVLRTG